MANKRHKPEEIVSKLWGRVAHQICIGGVASHAQSIAQSLMSGPTSE